MQIFRRLCGMAFPAWLLSCVWLALMPAAHADAGSDITVHVQKNGETIIVDASFMVAATPRETWKVLTDFDHMSSFISNLSSSQIIGRNGDKLQVAQAGKAARGLLSFSFESVREVELQPFHTIRTRQLSGSTKRMEGMTQLRADGEMTRVDYHGESVPAVWVPPVVGMQFIEREVREQFQEMRAEILRRKIELKGS